MAVGQLLKSCFKIPGEFPSASENVVVKAGESARILEIRVDSTNADRRFCSRAKTAGDFKTASYIVVFGHTATPIWR